MADFIHNPDGDERIGDHLRSALTSGRWLELHGAVAFVRASGVQHLADALRQFGEAGGICRLAVGVDLEGSSEEGLRLLIDSVAGDARICVLHNENHSTFHPKLWLFENVTSAHLVIGSGNLTGGGLYTNYEASMGLSLDKSIPNDEAIVRAARETIVKWNSPDGSIVRLLDAEAIDDLVRSGYVLSERAIREIRERERQDNVTRTERPPRLFASVRVPPAPARSQSPAFGGLLPTRRSQQEIAEPVQGRGFLMTLQKTDVGVGQTSSGTSRRSPELFVPLAARDYDPDFWGWPNKFSEDPSRAGKFDRLAVRVRLGTNTIAVNMMTWPVKHDFRLRSEALRSSGDVGDILRLETIDGGAQFEYYAEVIPQGTTLFAQYDALCVQPVRNSIKRWGYYGSTPPEA